MSYHGDVKLGDTIDIKFTTRAFASGAPTTLSGSPVISAYVDNGTTEITAGITLTVDFDSRTGLNNVRVVASGGNGFAAGTNVELVITTGTVGGTSVVGEVVGSFSIENRCVNWAKVVSPTTTVDLSGTTIKTTQKVDVDTIKTNPVVNGGTITFPTNKTLAATDNITAATGIDVTKWNGSAVSAPATAGIPEVNIKNINNVSAAAVTTVKAVQGLTTADTIVTVSGNVNGSVGSVTGAVGSVTGNVGGNVAGSVGSVTAAVTVGTNNDKTGYTLANNGLDSGALTAAAKNAIADALLDRNMATGTDSGTDSTATRTVRQALRILRNKASIAAGTLTVTKEDDTTASWTAAITTAAGNPISVVDPT